MGLITLKQNYRCSDDCVQSGCPSHEAVLEYMSVTDSYTFKSDRQEKYFERGELEAFIELLDKMGKLRADGVHIREILNRREKYE